MDLGEKLNEGWPAEAWRDVHVAVALSGGADSVALLHGLAELKRQHDGKGKLLALHVNHQLRGAESDGDAAWCSELCRTLSLPCEVMRAEVAARADADGDGLEAAARQERYRLLTAACEQRGVRYLATAHTRDDNIETVLFRLLRGTGLRGLAGIASHRPLTNSLTVVRPLLACSRAEVVGFLRTLGQDFRTDSSNSSREFIRNRIRNELLPMLRREFSSNVDDAIERLAEQAGEVNEFLELAANKLLGEAQCQVSSGAFQLNISAFGTRPSLVIREALRLAWRGAGLPEQAMTHQWWCQLAEFVKGNASNIVLNLPGNVRVERVGEVLVIERSA
jgi:tRNA(Ile)-lysidine synthase